MVLRRLLCSGRGIDPVGMTGVQCFSRSEWRVHAMD